MRRAAILFIFTVLYCIPHYISAQNSIPAYIAKYRELAVELSSQYCIPASIILSVAIIESGACNSNNCKLLNNHFGIKTKKKYRIPGTKKITYYKKYDSDTASYIHFCEWLMSKNFYQDICGSNNYKLWAKSISRSGYSRSPANWKYKVQLMIKKYGLSEYDKDCFL